ncbi:MAG: (deoxy)nucleoside triphosphate pyrophosphohydrolase [Aestuariivita sp.]|nr:(deoxy)nucleoside triphosphate pyrophosphohydrolase [Aestuariivita sp.]MCY4345857.1 (deoxy)nucleoside triphosphate pyrophosphohydrolase [Aestuariivita sp.]
MLTTDPDPIVASTGRPPMMLVVTLALIDRDGRVLLSQRPEGKFLSGLWEFPGGKVRAGEMPEAALIREIDEELGLSITGSCLAPLSFASHCYDEQHLLLLLFVCRKWDGIPRPNEGQALKWVGVNELKQYPMPPANLPLVAQLRDYL